MKATLANSEDPSLQMAEIDDKWWFERPLRNESRDQIEEAIDSLLLIHNQCIAQAKGRPTDVQRNLRREKEKSDLLVKNHHNLSQLIVLLKKINNTQGHPQ